jgi:hypothetical protein
MSPGDWMRSKSGLAAEEIAAAVARAEEMSPVERNRALIDSGILPPHALG